MSVKPTKCDLESLTPELAKEFAAMKHLPGERPLKASRVKFFLDHIKNGTFIMPRWSVGVERGNGEKYRLDGQHTSTALAALDPDAFPKDLLVLIQTYEFDSIGEDGFQMFDMFDHPSSVRGNPDAMVQFRSGFEQMYVFTPRFLTQATNGIAIYNQDLADRKLDAWVVSVKRNRGVYLQEENYRRFIQWLGAFQETKYPWILQYPGIVAEMLADWNDDPLLAKTAWNLVFNESHEDPDHESRELLGRLINLRVKRKRDQKQIRKNAQTFWKRFRKDQQFGTDDTSVSALGAPFSDAQEPAQL